MLNINIKRIEHDLLELAKFGAVKGGSGVTRQAFTPDDMASRKWFMEKLEAEGFVAKSVFDLLSFKLVILFKYTCSWPFGLKYVFNLEYQIWPL